MYCSNKTNENANLKCECFSQLIVQDLENRFTKNELDKIKENPVQAANEFRQSYQNQKKEIDVCFKKNGESSGILDEIFDDIKKTSFDLFESISTE